MRITVTVNIPGLPELVAYLVGRQQAEVDAIAAKVAAGVERLSGSAAALNGAIPTK